LSGVELEKSGWRQGAVVQQVNIAGIFDSINQTMDSGIVLIVASQSCDIVSSNLESEPFIELSIARLIEETDGNLTHNKNPRLLHATLQIRTSDGGVSREQYIELKAYEKLTIPKEYFCDLVPDQNCLLNDIQLEGYVSWLAARYSRPALPSEFNDRLVRVDPRGKLRKKAKRANEQLSGIYVEIVPDAEISSEEIYAINLLGLVSSGFEGNLTEVQTVLDEYAEVMRQASMDVNVVLKRESEISVAAIKRFKRFYYDDLSFKDDQPLPPEVDNTL